MKILKKSLGIGLMLAILFGACSKKISNDRIDTLEGREALLEKTTKLNKLKLELEKNMVKQKRLTDDVEKINRDASDSASDAQNLSVQVSRNPGDSGLSNRANKASQRAAKDAKTAKKLNNGLDDVNNKIRDLGNNIDKTERELSELRSRVEFVPNSQ